MEFDDELLAVEFFVVFEVKLEEVLLDDVFPLDILLPTVTVLLLAEGLFDISPGLMLY